MALQNCRPREASALAELLRQASSRPWAAELCAVTSLGQLRLTSLRTHDDETPAGSLHLSVVEGGNIALSYTPPHPVGHGVRRVSSPSEALGALELMLIRLFEDHGAEGPEALSRDKDPERPRLQVGSRVRVIQNERNRTPHTGVVALHIWHYKFACWHYFIREQGKRVSKRYLAEDLEPWEEG